MLVTGGRDFSYPQAIASTLMRIHRKSRIKLLVAGGAKGVDSHAEKWARGIGLPVCVHYAKWNLHGRYAGPKRNAEMADHHPEAVVVAFPGGRGTAHMVSVARKRGMPVLEIELDGYGVRD